MSLARNVLSVLNKLLVPLGVRVRRSTVPTRSFQEFFEHLRRLGFHARTVVDVGVAAGTPELYAGCPRAKFFLVEPVAEAKEWLTSLAQRLDATVINAAAGESDGVITLHVHSDVSGSSIHPHAEGTILDGVQREVRSVRLETALPAGIQRPCILKIDTQGAELLVLRGLGSRFSEIDLVIVEVSLMEFRLGAPLLADVVRFFDERGWVAYDILDGEMRAFDGALAQVDVVFVPRDSPLRAERAFFSPAQARRYARQWGGSATPTN